MAVVLERPAPTHVNSASSVPSRPSIGTHRMSYSSAPSRSVSAPLPGSRPGSTPPFIGHPQEWAGFPQHHHYTPNGFSPQFQYYQQQQLPGQQQWSPQQLAAWAAAYQSMMFNQATSPQHQQSPFQFPSSPYTDSHNQFRPPPPLGHRRRTSSGPSPRTHTYNDSSTSTNSAGGYSVSSPPPQRRYSPQLKEKTPTSTQTQPSTITTQSNGNHWSTSPAASPQRTQPPPPSSPNNIPQGDAGFHPYRRPAKKTGIVSDGPEIFSPKPVVASPVMIGHTGGSIDSTSSSNSGTTKSHNPNSSVSSSTSAGAGGSGSGDSLYKSTVTGGRRSSVSSEKSSRPPSSSASPPPSVRAASPSSSFHERTSSTSKPLSKPSPLSQSTGADSDAGSIASALEKKNVLSFKFGVGSSGKGKKTEESLTEPKKQPEVPLSPPAPASNLSSLPSLPASKSLSALRAPAPSVPASSLPSPAFNTESSLNAPFRGSSQFETASFESVSFTAAPVNEQPSTRKKSLFSMKNASTDNISIASAASSASMMIRKIGSGFKMARKNSLAGISNIFKDKETKSSDDVPEGKPTKEKKKGFKGFGRKAAASSSTVSHFTAEHDRTGSGGFDEDAIISGLSPAAKLARQHTLKSKAQEEEAVSRPSASPSQRSSMEVPPAWERNTSSRQSGESQRDSPAWARGEQEVDEFGGGYDEENGFDSEFEEFSRPATPERYSSWGRGKPDLSRVPIKGILKAVSSYSDSSFPEGPAAPWTRGRTNSADTTSDAPNAMPTLPPSDPDHIDGLHHHHYPKQTSNSSVYDPFSADFNPFGNHNADVSIDLSIQPPTADRFSSPFSNPTHNSSAPALAHYGEESTITSSVHLSRAQTAPLQKKQLVWAPNCAVYHTFASEAYDRRSEPGTANRLTPQLAQEIKAFLNQYKLEEMEVHPASRNHTHFFV